MAGGKFAWVRPEVYPLIATMAVALGVCGYAITRNFWTNPDVHLNKQHRMEGVPDSDQSLSVLRAKGYSNSVFRDLQKERQATMNVKIFS